MRGIHKIVSVLGVFLVGCVLAVPAQKLAVLNLEKSEIALRYAERLTEEIAKKYTVLDPDLAAAAFRATAPVNPLNMTSDESKKIGAAIGCDYFLMITPSLLRRSAYQIPEYYEANAAAFLVSSRSGRLILWDLPRFDALKPALAENRLLDSAASSVEKITEKIIAARRAESAIVTEPEIEAVPEDNSPAAKNFKAPIPYSRRRPEYTAEAAFYNVRATVEILVDLEADGTIRRTQIARWAGYGLDESVENAVRKMQWRPAYRDSKPLPIRFLLRYNFKKIEKT